MEYFKINVFRESFGPIIELLNEHKVEYQMREVRSGVVMNSSGVIEVLQSAAMWGSTCHYCCCLYQSKKWAYSHDYPQR